MLVVKERKPPGNPGQADSFFPVLAALLCLVLSSARAETGQREGGTAVEVRTETTMLPGGRPVNDELVVSCWDQDPVDHERNLAERAEVIQAAEGALFESRVGNVHDGRMVSEVKGAFDDYGEMQYILDQTANSWVPAPGSEVEFALDDFHDLRKIEVFTSYEWTRTGQKYDIYTSSDRGGSWSKLASVDYPNENVHSLSGWLSRRVTVESPSAVLAKGVNAVKFVFPGNDPVEGAHPESVYSEIAIYGSEP